jgi:hypothetical protein
VGTEYIPKVGERVYVLGKSGEWEVVDLDDEGHVRVRLIGTHHGLEHQGRFPYQAITPIKTDVEDATFHGSSQGEETGWQDVRWVGHGGQKLY